MSHLLHHVVRECNVGNVEFCCAGCELNCQEVAKILLKHGAIVDIELGASKNKLTPLMIACSVGGLEFVRLLVSHRANPLYKGSWLSLAFCAVLIVLHLLRPFCCKILQVEFGVL